MAEQIRVFISHHHSPEEDRFTARLKGDLQAAGADVWVDDERITSDDFIKKINEGMAGRQWLVLVMTPDSLRSQWVQREVNAALNLAGQGSMRGVIPVVAKPCNPKEIPALWATLHRYDATRDYQSALFGLLRALGLPLPVPPQPQPNPQPAPHAGPQQQPPRPQPAPPLVAPTRTASTSGRGLSRRTLLIGGVAGIVVVGAGATALSAQVIGKGASRSPTQTPVISPLVFRGHTDAVFSVAWSPDSKRIASGSRDTTVQVWDAASGANPFVYRGHHGFVMQVSWSHDGKRIASAGGLNDETAQVWDAADGARPFFYQGHGAHLVTAIGWSSDDKRIASGGSDNKLRIWDASDGGNALALGPASSALAAILSTIAWSHDGKRVVWAGEVDSDAEILTFSSAGGPVDLTLSEGKPADGTSKSIIAAAWSPDGQYLASGDTGDAARVWDATTGKTFFTFTGHSDIVASVSWSPDGKYIASGSWDKTVQVWNPSDGTVVFTYRGHTNQVVSVAWSPDGKHIASGGWDDTVHVWPAP